MIACLDAAYRGDRAFGACVLFAGWTDPAPTVELVREAEAGGPYRPGELYRRELPCLLAALRAAPEPPSLVIVDGYVWLTTVGRPGLGAHLWEALGRTPAVVGVAKDPYPGAPAVPVRRGRSRRPLFVGAAGAEPAWAAARVAAMHGPFRIPALLARADRLSRAAAAGRRGL